MRITIVPLNSLDAVVVNRRSFILDWEDHVDLCGFCLVKHANGWKEHIENGGV